jgi:hypothetical protein
MRLTRNILCAILFLLPTAILATNDSIRETYLSSLEERYWQEYRECTGDSGPVPSSVLYLWIKELDRRAQAFDYNAVVKEYRKAHDDIDLSNIKRCRVIAWKEEQLVEAQRKQDTLRLDSTKRAEAVAESLHLVEVRSEHPASSFDFRDIPFGTTKSDFLMFFKRLFSLSMLQDTMRDSLIAYAVPWGNRTCVTSFCFGRYDKLYKYVVEGPRYPLDSIDVVLRSAAASLGALFQQKMGKPGGIGRVGLFDIKENRIAPLMIWNTGTHYACIGLSSSDFKYFVKASIVNKEMAASVKKQWEEGIEE